MASTLGVYSEVGKLSTMLLRRPALELTRLTPDNRESLLFDDVIRVRKARPEHREFEDAIRDRGGQVLRVREMLEEALQNPESRRWPLHRRINENGVGVGLMSELPFEPKGMFARVLEADEIVLPPLPNQMFTRDTSCWIFNGVTLNPMYWPVRRLETLNLAAIYRFHPVFVGARCRINQ